MENFDGPSVIDFSSEEPNDPVRAVLQAPSISLKWRVELALRRTRLVYVAPARR